MQEIDGHNVDAVKYAIAKARTTDMPSMIACKTTIGFGAPTKAGTNGVHGAALGGPEIEQTRKNLRWDAGPFEIPGDIDKMWKSTKDRNTESYKAWHQRFNKYGKKGEITRIENQELPKNYD